MMVMSKEEIRIYHKQRYERKKEELKAKQKIRYEKNKKEILRKQKIYRGIHKEERTKHYEENKKEILRKQKRYNDAHKKEKAEYDQNYYRTPKGLLTKIWSHMLENSKCRQHPNPNFTKKELSIFIFIKNKNKFDKSWEIYVNSNYKIDNIPSINRLDDYVPYTFKNIELTTWKDNRHKGYKCEKTLEAHRIGGAKGGKNSAKILLQLSLNDEIIKQFVSAVEAQKQLGFNMNCIRRVCRGERKTSYGFKWRYKEDTK